MKPIIKISVIRHTSESSSIEDEFEERERKAKKQKLEYYEEFDWSSS